MIVTSRLLRSCSEVRQREFNGASEDLGVSSIVDIFMMLLACRSVVSTDQKRRYILLLPPFVLAVACYAPFLHVSHSDISRSFSRIFLYVSQ